MTDPRISASDDVAPKSTAEAADIVTHDPALNAATRDSRDDAATDEDARADDTDPAA
ncbi:hypothetical protein [Jidongwangia harbinensis]|uniref:hypothetical protein n=1 Tax=Jidongwangia harbinensis TaxID=2878561 RepID=UPI001CDA01C3|nr:hypothetical protein [Jidongwangia harbinensis]MCA2215747.1 hypothetical protein [Jidongwangia harbinensis]